MSVVHMIDFTKMKREELIKNEKLHNNMEDINMSHDHEYFDVMFAGQNIHI